MGRAAWVGLCLGLMLVVAMGQEGKDEKKGGDAQPPGGLKPPGGYDDTYVATAETKDTNVAGVRATY